ncbi:monocarboxylate transporter 12-like [Dermacentor albipictus]|uniref:monocarboxylate transporter 12-like n=1 Tax=Dermacentor albipictus TaxID=60249 RepID=UPI0038FD2DEA
MVPMPLRKWRTLSFSAMELLTRRQRFMTRDRKPLYSMVAVTVADQTTACADKKKGPAAASPSNGKKGMPRYGPDSVHSWMTAGACALATFFGVGGRRSSGFLYVAILDTFNATRSQAAWPIVLLGGVLLLTGLVAGPLAHRYTARPVAIVGGTIGALGLIASYFATNIEYLVFSLGVVHAIGSGMLFVAIPTVINEHFVRYKGFAMGINFAGATMGTFVFPKFLQMATNQYGFKSALLLFGALCLNAVAFSLFLRQPSWLKKKLKEQKEEQVQVEKLRGVKDTSGHTVNGGRIAVPNGLAEDKTSRNKIELVPGSFRHGLTVFSCPMFYVVMYSYISFSFAFECYISLLVDFAIDRGVSVSNAVTVLSTSSVVCLVGRLILPVLADKGYFTRQALMTVCLACIGCLYIMLPLVESYAMVFVMAVSIGFCVGIPVVLFSVLCAEYVGIERVSMAFGMVSASAGMTSLVRPPIIGYFRDMVGSYDNLFHLCGSAVTLAAIIWIFVHIRLCATSKHTSTLGNGTLYDSEDASVKKNQP